MLKSFSNRNAGEAQPFEIPSVIQGAVRGHYRSCGSSNGDKIYYVIWRANYGAGFFSNLSFVLGHLKLAIENGMVPIVDFENFPTTYNEPELIDGERNSWKYYFRQVSDHSLDEVYSSKHVFFCDGGWPSGFHHNITRAQRPLFNLYEERIRFSPAVMSHLTEAESIITNKTLGVHFRGTDQNVAPGHWFGPTVKQVFVCIDSILSSHDVDRIFVVTEDPSYLQILRERYGTRIAFLDSYRHKNATAYNEDPRHRHRYLLGMEICVEAILLSRCLGLVYGPSNVSDFAVFANNGNFKVTHQIHNGQNSYSRHVAPRMYRLKKILPPFLGGLQNDVVIRENGKSYKRQM